ncbi:MAG TPA: hypothetical protein VES65_11475 [Solirubrobacteraceae bacterium]|nr:hypothetical protein [Solirubrobacteraceae bacterium]
MDGTSNPQACAPARPAGGSQKSARVWDTGFKPVPLEQFDNFYATVRPVRTDDLKPGVAAWIGKRLLFRAMGAADEGTYAGDQMCMPIGPDGDRFSRETDAAWMPERDLCDVQVVQDAL